MEIYINKMCGNPFTKITTHLYMKIVSYDNWIVTTKCNVQLVIEHSFVRKKTMFMKRKTMYKFC